MKSRLFTALLLGTVFALVGAACPALAKPSPAPAPTTTVGSVTADGAYRVTSDRIASVPDPSHPGKSVSARITTLVPVTESPLSCTIIVTDFSPQKIDRTNGTSYVSASTHVEPSDGCKSLTWTHTLSEQEYFGGGDYEFVVKRSASVTANPGVVSQNTLGSTNCVDFPNTEWLNDTNLSTGKIATLGCHV